MSDSVSQDEYHPSYSFPDADLVLASKDDLKFRVHSQILKLVSGFFSEMLAIPRATSEKASDPIVMTESADILVALLDAAYPNFGQHRHGLSDALSKSPESVVLAAEKYDMHGVIEYIRTLLFHGTPALPATTPIGMYNLARKCGWDAEAKLASTRTLHIDLTSADAISDLEKVDSCGVLKLQELHRKRKTLLFDMITNPRPSVFQYTCDCHEALYLLNSNYKWILFLYHVSEKMKNPSYANILNDPSFWDEPECNEMFDTEYLCPGSQFWGKKKRVEALPSGELVYLNKQKFITEVQLAIASLPRSI
ncbi:hypothetical protein EW145_g7015 [Phellinidium pouzarii]|uniref:BTB domain-containing protein n=1 Tax=Phellinidium pouzarii TaxID=167371 RepID=A0A4V3XB75_9AGAM|nr:hypothetical protein EW145_g7015 [Phellinidium pouzarii]